jgi:hypothetical protein
MAAGHVVLMKHRWVSFYHSLPLFMPRQLNTLRVLSWDFDLRFLEQILSFFHCGVLTALFGHLGHIQGQAHVRLFQL